MRPSHAPTRKDTSVASDCQRVDICSEKKNPVKGKNIHTELTEARTRSEKANKWDENRK
jgi:hypothetical protein